MLRLLRPQATLVACARFRNRFMPTYSTHAARSYEASRQGAKWRRETEVFREFYDIVRPATVLDCPIGSGRWIGIYEERGAAVLGVDLSPYMLAEAERKTGLGTIRFKRADLLKDTRSGILGRGYDLVVCTRFIHWLAWRDVLILLENLASTDPRYLIVGAKVASATDRRPRRVKGRLLSYARRLRSRLFPITHAHDESKLLSAFEQAGWRLIDRKRIAEARDSMDLYYLLQNDRRQPLRDNA